MPAASWSGRDRLTSRPGLALAQTVDDGGGNLPADGVGAENAGIEMQKLHERSPLV